MSTKGLKVKRVLVTTGGGFLAGLLAIGVAWGYLAVVENKLYQGLSFDA